MKKVFLIGCILCSFLSSYSQQQNDAQYYEQRIKKFKTIKKTGIALTAVGGVALLVGVALQAEERHDRDTTNPGYTPQDEGTTTGEKMTIGSLFLIGPGIPLWIVGGQGESKYYRKLNSLSFKPSLNQRQVALTLRYKF